MSTLRQTYPAIVGTAQPEPPKIIANDTSETEPMPPRRTTQETAQYDESIESLMKAFLISQTAQAKPQNGNRWTGWIQTGVICGMLLVSGTSRFTTSESDLKQDLAVTKIKGESQAAALAVATDRIQSLEYIWARMTNQMAALGIQIDPKTGEVTVRRGK